MKFNRDCLAEVQVKSWVPLRRTVYMNLPLLTCHNCIINTLDPIKKKVLMIGYSAL